MSINTQAARANRGEITPEMAKVAAKEYLEPEFIRAEVAAGRIVIPANVNHPNLDPIGIGKSLTTKINANIGKSPLSSCPKQELEKLKMALKYGADTVMDLSTGDNVDITRKTIIANSPAPIGTVPIYEAVSRVEKAEDISLPLILEVIKEQAEQGVDYMTIHAGLLSEHVPMAMKRVLGIVSRGGALIAKWMDTHKQENPFYQCFDKILEICREYDVTLSLGDGLRPGCLADASDAAQFAELDSIAALVKRCRAVDVQAMVEGPGHVPLDEIEMNMTREDKVCEGAPFYILGPIVVDCAPGYDHITSSIGATMGAYYGASMLCYVTPKEHLGLPNARDVRDGVIAYKIAAHAADVALKRPHARDRDDAISQARAEFDWEKQFSLALDPDRARDYREESIRERSEAIKAAPEPEKEDSRYCTMCGPQFCSMRLSREVKDATQ